MPLYSKSFHVFKQRTENSRNVPIDRNGQIASEINPSPVPRKMRSVIPPRQNGAPFAGRN
jgi:hypothetical protein